DLERLRRSQKHLLRLIDELLNYARVETGSVRLTLGEVCVRDALASVETLIMPQLRAKNFSLVVAPCTAELVAYADEEKLQQILLNLLSNSSKFTSDGGTIEMSASRSVNAHGRDLVEIRVADNGIGIPAEHLESIFQPFVQVGRALNHPVEGTGLGLAISRDLARSMNGDLVARSEMDVGSEFVLSLPTVQAGL
ncbi:MAG TPA: ATP-binding protein, partial [Gemmatimonadales bacterium]|nr:ATP-binding protein [Gemmatimonadales bacterium]